MWQRQMFTLNPLSQGSDLEHLRAQASAGPQRRPLRDCVSVPAESLGASP